MTLMVMGDTGGEKLYEFHFDLRVQLQFAVVPPSDPWARILNCEDLPALLYSTLGVGMVSESCILKLRLQYGLLPSPDKNRYVR
jgi:hypothetical protein